MKRPHGRDGTPSGRPSGGRPLAGLAAIVALVIGAVGVLGISRAAPAAGAEGSGETVARNAATLYLQNCASCHGPQGQGAAAGPPLVGVGAASVDFYLRTGRMPLGAPDQRPHRQPPAFDEAEIRALVEHVVGFGGEGPPIPVVRSGGDVNRGWELYTANCAACHAATGAGNAVGGGFVAVGLSQASNLEIAEAMLIGPGVMPRFEFSDEERQAIIAYVDYLRQAESPGGAPIGGFGPVAEGFVAVTVGLVVMVLVAMFVGRRTHAGEPGTPADAIDDPNLADDAGTGSGGGPRTA